MEIINLTNRKVYIEIPGWSMIIIRPSEEGVEIPSEPRENTIYIVPPELLNKYEGRNDIVTPKGVTTTSDAYPRYAGCWYL